MRYSGKQRRLKRHLAVVSCAYYLGAAFSNNQHHVSAGILPPPPPPPPRNNGRENLSLSESSTTVNVESNVTPKSSVISEENPGGTGDEEIVRREPIEKITNGDALKPLTNSVSKITNDDTSKDSIWEARGNGHGSSSHDAWQATPPKINTQQQHQQRPPPPVDAQHHPNNQQWSSAEQISPKYSEQYYDQQQHQHASSWGQGYQQQPSPQQQQNYQQQQQYQSQHPNAPNQQHPPGQLAVYNRRPTPNPPRKSASSLFSLAVKKLQTGIETVSETIDVDKMTSSVSSLTSDLTSRIGHISGNIVGGTSGGKSAPPHGRQGPGNRSMGGGGPGAGMGRPPQQQQYQRQGNLQYPQQRMTPPDSRQQQQQQRPIKKKETCAPAMSELYSLGQPQEKVNGGMSDEDTDPHVMHTDSTDGEEEDGVFPDMMQQRMQSGPKQPVSTAGTAQPRPFPNGGSSKPSPREVSPRGRNTPQQIPVGGRRPQQSSSSSPLRPRNGDSMTPAAARRRVQNDDDDYYNSSSSIGRKLKWVAGACVPRVPRLFKRSTITNDDEVWSDDEAKEVSYTASASRGRGSSRSAGGKSSVGIVPHPVHSLLNKRTTLLSTEASRRCVSIGRTQAVLDAAQLALLVGTIQEVLPIFFQAVAAPVATPTIISPLAGEGGSNSFRVAILSTLLSSMDGWSPYGLMATFLLYASNKVWVQPALKSVYEEQAMENAAEASYAQLYLRLMASIPMRNKSGMEESMRKTARAVAVQIASLARLRFFVTLAVLYVVLSTVAVLRPAGAALLSAMVDVVRLQVWRDRPIEWKIVWEGVKLTGLGLGQSLRALFLIEWNILREQPIRVAVVVSLLVALLSVSYLPSLEDRQARKTGGRVNQESNEAEEEDGTISSLWSNIGASSATRLGLLSAPRGVEGALEQFVKLRPDRANAAGIALPGKQSKLSSKKKRHPESLVDLGSSLQPLLRKAMYSASSLLILSVPLAIYCYLFVSTSLSHGVPISLSSVKAIPENGWIALSQLATLLLFTHLQAGSAVSDVLSTNALRQGRSSLSSFFHKLGQTVEELRNIAEESSAGADFQAMVTASPTKGISVVDLWAAHASRRAWAVKGANIQCQNGEVVMILGADGSGKTRLLTSIAERIFVPPKSARTTTHVRGSVRVAGVDLSKWDKMQLQKRVGVCLNDVRTVSDYASLMAGCTMEEILEPVVAGGRVGPKERNSVSVAMKITGLGSTVSRLPSKLSTVVSANEDELKPSSSQPYPSYPLSPSDWSRVLLTKVLAQLISGNDAQPSSSSLSNANDAVRNSMMGSILLLDDPTSQMSEVDEAKIITALRSTGAAVLLTSNRWASGRFADRIVVLDSNSGAVVESGTHADLINLGPERSLYAREWSTMAST